MDKKIFDNDTLTSQEKLDEIYVKVGELYRGEIEKDNLIEAIETSYIPVVFAKLKADGNCEEIPDPFNFQPPDAPAAAAGGGAAPAAAADKAHQDLLAEYEGKCSSITEIKSDGLCFYRAILTSLGENADDIASKEFAAQIGDWLENNKATEVSDNGVIKATIQQIYDDNFTGEEFTVFYNNVGGNKQQLTLDQYIEKSQDFSKSKDACCPMVYAEATIAGHAAANLKNINIITYDTSNIIISLYTPIKGISDRTVKLQHKDGNHFNVCKNDGGGAPAGGNANDKEVNPQFLFAKDHANFRKRRQSGGSRNRRVTPIGKKIGGISLKKRTPKSKKKSRSKNH